MADTAEKCQPYILMLAHYHLDHSGDRHTFTSLLPDTELFPDLPDVYLVSDPTHRERFRQLAEELRALESRGVQELERLAGLPDNRTLQGGKPEVRRKRPGG